MCIRDRYAAVRIASLPEIRPLVADWDFVAGSARSALEIDIDDKLMQTMVASKVELVEPDEKLERTWARIKKGHANLGGQLELLEAIQRRNPGVRQMREWLLQTFPVLANERRLADFITEVNRVRETGNQGILGSVGERSAREAIDGTSDLLAFLHRVTRRES